MPLQETSGAASYDAFGGGAAAVTNYIEDVFSTYLYTQNTSGQGVPLVTGVGFTSTDAWQSNVVLTTANGGPRCAFDANGNYYIAMGDGSSGGYVAKYSSAGIKTWLVKLSPSAQSLGPYSIKVTSAGDVYVAGIRSGAGAAFICKLTSSGSVSWTRELAVYGSGWVGMDVDSSENIHLVYTTTSTLRGGYAKFNSSGTQDTSASKNFYTATQTFPRSVTVDSSGNVYVSGNYYDSAVARYYGFVIKFNSSMVVQWNRALYNTAAETTFNGVSVDSSGNVYVTGKLRATNDVILTAKYNSSGTLQWQKQLSKSGSSIEGYAIKVDSSGNSYVSGYGVGGWQIQAIDTTGTSLWQKSFLLTTYVNYPIGYSIDINASNVLVSGPSNESTSSSTNRTQVLRIGLSGASNGVTQYGTLATSSLTFGNAAGVAQTQTFTVASGDTFSTVTYTSASDLISESLITIAATTSTGGLCWLKNRSAAANHLLALSETSYLFSNLSGAASAGTYISALSSNGVLIPSDYATTNNFVSWSFKKQAKFFDIVTYTGDGSASPRQIAHSLGSVPGFIVIKRIDTTSDWTVWHRSVTGNAFLQTTDAWQTGYTRITTPDSTTFTVGASIMVNASGGTYVAYLFAHNAGGFGLSGTDNVISCGSYTGNPGVRVDINLGYEPQWLLVKRASDIDQWVMADVMRGIPTGSADPIIYAESTAAENSGGGDFLNVSPTGFYTTSGNNAVNGASTYIYIAIRRGPMKVPTSGTSVYQPLTNQPLSGGLWNHNILTDFSFYHWQNGTQNWGVQDRLRGSPDLSFNSTAAENGLIGGNSWDVMNGYKNSNPGAGAYNSWAFRRAPGFMDVVCYTGTGVARTVTHNLGVVPELIIVKGRSQAGTYWVVRHPSLTAGNVLILNLDYASTENSTVFTTTAPTASVFSVGTNDSSNASGQTLVAYLFATVARVSKVGSYTGTGTTQVINCGFTAGSRFVMIKRTDSTGDWYVWDSARGIVAGNDPYVLLNSGATNVTGTDYIDTAATGFEISSTAPAAINANGGSFIFLAIA